MSMLRHRSVRDVAAQAHLLVPARSADDVLYRDELKTRDPRQGCASRTPTAGAPPGWTGWRGRINAAMLADVVGEVAGAEMSAVLRTRQSCGDRRAIGELRSYRSVGVVLRCPACEDVGVVLGVQEKRLVVEWRGLYDVAR